MPSLLQNAATPTLLIYDDIGPDWLGLIGAKTVADALAQLGPVEALTVRINSVGGDVFEGTAIYNLLAQHPAQVTVQIDGAALSIASIIALAGDTVRMAANGYYMIHDPWTFALGGAEELRKQAEVLDKIKAAIVGTYAEHTGQSAEQLADWMSAETWMTAEEAKARGFVDEVAAAADKSAQAAAPYRWKNAPAAWRQSAKEDRPDAAWRRNLAHRRLQLES